MSDLERVFADERPFLWGVAYRLTGNAADADDVVQTAFVRALERPPVRTDLPWRPWLVRVTLNLGRDLLRRRRRRGYQGPWLPSPIETPDELSSPEPADPAPGPLARYEMVESLSFAFLLALEQLTPTQRAVLLLRDVFDYTADEVAELLETSAAAVRQAHRRARRSMARYDAQRRAVVPRADVAETLQRFLTAVAGGDAAAAASLLSDDVVQLADGGGEFAAARVPIQGRERVSRLFLGLAQRAGAAPRVAARRLNGQTALLIETPPSRARGAAPRLTLHARLASDGRIAAIWVVLASRKLGHVRWS